MDLETIKEERGSEAVELALDVEDLSSSQHWFCFSRFSQQCKELGWQTWQIFAMTRL